MHGPMNVIQVTVKLMHILSITSGGTRRCPG